MKTYMMSSYPAWVRSWLASRGGLNGRLVTMNYAYASRYMRTCPTQTADAEARKVDKAG
jgi:hypothetical protein